MDNLYNDYPSGRMASVFNINRGGFYRWKKHPFTKSSIFEYIEIFYNRKRRHSYLGLVNPMDFEYKYNQKTYENAA